jgi:hypothetical protein
LRDLRAARVVFVPWFLHDGNMFAIASKVWVETLDAVGAIAEGLQKHLEEGLASSFGYMQKSQQQGSLGPPRTKIRQELRESWAWLHGQP